MKNKEKVSSFLGALLVKAVYYFAFSAVFILLFWWAGIIDGFKWKYAVVMMLGLLFLRIFIAEIAAKAEKK